MVPFSRLLENLFGPDFTEKNVADVFSYIKSKNGFRYITDTEYQKLILSYIPSWNCDLNEVQQTLEKNGIIESIFHLESLVIHFSNKRKGSWEEAERRLIWLCYKTTPSIKDLSVMLFPRSSDSIYKAAGRFKLNEGVARFKRTKEQGKGKVLDMYEKPLTIQDLSNTLANYPQDSLVSFQYVADGSISHIVDITCQNNRVDVKLLKEGESYNDWKN